MEAPPIVTPTAKGTLDAELGFPGSGGGGAAVEDEDEDGLPEVGDATGEEPETALEKPVGAVPGDDAFPGAVIRPVVGALSSDEAVAVAVVDVEVKVVVGAGVCIVLDGEMPIVVNMTGSKR